MPRIREFFGKFSISWMGLGPGLILYLLLGSAIFSVVALDWAARRFTEYGALYGRYVGLNCLGFIALSFYIAVRRRTRVAPIERIMIWAESIPLAVALIVALAYASIAGSVYSSVEPAYGKAYIFHSYWYLGLVVMLAVNLVLCSWQKSVQVFLLPGRRDFRDSEGFFASARHAAAIPFAGTREEAEGLFRSVYRRAAFDGTGCAYIQKGVFSRFGPTVVHIGLLIVFAAGGYRILSERIGLHFINRAAEKGAIPSEQIRWMGLFDSQIQIQEGSTASTIVVKRERMTPFSEKNSREVQLDFTVKCHNFEAEMYPGTQTPKYFGSLLEITDTRGRTKIATVDMNTAVEFHGYKFSQNSYSAIPTIPRATMELVDLQTDRRYRTDVGPDTRNKLDNKGEMARYQLWVGGLETGSAWKLYDTQGGDEAVIAQGELLAPGGSMKLEPIAFFRDFIMEDGGPVDRSEEPNNPALILSVATREASIDRLAFVFERADLPTINGPDGYEIDILEFRAAGAPPSFERTGDVPPRPAPGRANAGDAAAAGSEEESAWNERVKALREGRREVTDAYEYRLGVMEVATGRMVATGWTAPGRPIEVPLAASFSGSDDPRVSGELAAAKERGDRWAVLNAGPTQGFMTVLGVIRDPSLPSLYAGCLIVIFGVLQCFSMTYREAWMAYRPAADGAGGAVVYLALKLRGSGEAPFNELERLKRAFARRGSGASSSGRSAASAPSMTPIPSAGPAAAATPPTSVANGGGQHASSSRKKSAKSARSQKR